MELFVKNTSDKTSRLNKLSSSICKGAVLSALAQTSVKGGGLEFEGGDILSNELVGG